MKHQATHAIEPVAIAPFVFECRACRRQVVELEWTDGRRSWRHKAEGYRWGERAEAAERRYAELVASLRAVPAVVPRSVLLAMVEEP